MNRVALRVCCPLIGGILFATATAGLAQAYTPDQQQLCSDDAFRLCSSAIPDVDRVTACMIQRRAQLSPGCAQFFRDTTRDRRARPAGRKPLSISPRNAKYPRERS